MDATSYTHIIRVKRGASYTFTVARSGVNSAAGWAAKIDFRAKKDPDSTLYHSLSSPADFALSSSNGKLVFVVRLTPQDTATFDFNTAYFDLKLTAPDGSVSYPFDGILYVIPQVTL